MRATVLDVGHGCAVLIESDGKHALVDAGGRGAAVHSALVAMGVNRLEWVLITHADEDHVAGLLTLALNGIEIERLWANPDQSKTSRSWAGFAALLERRRLDRYDRDHYAIVAGDAPPALGGVTFSVLSPRLAWLYQHPHGATSNSLSVVLAVRDQAGIALLVTGDIDSMALDDLGQRLAAEGQSAECRVLLYPHHGGLPGSPEAAKHFTDSLLAMSKPREVVISHGRTRYSNPRPEVMARIREGSGARCVCTQLSVRCHDGPVPASPFPHAGNEACGSAIPVLLGGEGGIDPGHVEAHSGFVRQFGTRLCR